jgi:hypothetical protein
LLTHNGTTKKYREMFGIKRGTEREMESFSRSEKSTMRK